MSNDNSITFLKTRHVYDSYKDFFRLVELAGFPIIYADQLIPDEMEGIYITSPTNGDTEAHLRNYVDKERRCHIILWNIERPGSHDGSIKEYARANRQLMYDRVFDEIWVSDRQLAKETSLRYVTLGSNFGLGQPGNIHSKHYDFCHMSYTVPRRQTIYNPFMNIGPNCWGSERHKVLQQSHFALNVHQDQFPFCEPLRLALFASYGLPVISESLFDSHPYYDSIITDVYDDLPDTIRHCLKGPYKKYFELGERFRQKMCVEFEFKKCVDEAIYVQGLHWR